MTNDETFDALRLGKLESDADDLAEFPVDPIFSFDLAMLEAANQLDALIERGLITQQERDTHYHIVREAFHWAQEVRSRHG